MPSDDPKAVWHKAYITIYVEADRLAISTFKLTSNMLSIVAATSGE